MSMLWSFSLTFLMGDSDIPLEGDTNDFFGGDSEVVAFEVNSVSFLVMEDEDCIFCRF